MMPECTSHLSIEVFGKAIGNGLDFPGRIAIFEPNIEAAETCCFAGISVNVLLRALTFFYYIQISCWVYRPELQRQFRLFAILNFPLS